MAVDYSKVVINDLDGLETRWQPMPYFIDPNMYYGLIVELPVAFLVCMSAENNGLGLFFLFIPIWIVISHICSKAQWQRKCEFLHLVCYYYNGKPYSETNRPYCMSPEGIAENERRKKVAYLQDKVSRYKDMLHKFDTEDHELDDDHVLWYEGEWFSLKEIEEGGFKKSWNYWINEGDKEFTEEERQFIRDNYDLIINGGDNG